MDLPEIAVYDPDNTYQPAEWDAEPEAPEYITDEEIFYDDQGFPILDGHHHKSVSELLNDFGIPCADQPDTKFWPQKLLEFIISPERLVTDLQQKRLPPAITHATLGNIPKYLRIIALLCMMETEHDITHWINSDTTDAFFPFRAGKRRLVCEQQNPQFRGPSNWPQHNYDFFAHRQWGLLTPHFAPGHRGQPNHQKLPKGTILPWCKRRLGERFSWKETDRHHGGYGVVRGVLMPKCSHGFMPTLQGLGLKYNGFALKQLDPSSVRRDDRRLQKLFEHEVNQLKRFGRDFEPHLVLLLASFQLENQLYFLFPHAECDLSRLWMRDPQWKPGYMQWISRQFHGLIRAVKTIHEGLVEYDRSATLQPEGVRRYGRHGDIRPDNILWFKSTSDPFGILVLSDMGLSTFNRENSKSNQPNGVQFQIPGYHPPESVLEGGKINRTFDIWTLGCLFLEVIVWTLGGANLRAQFEEERRTLTDQGYYRNVFYEIANISSRGVHGAQVKHEVFERMRNLRRHPGCTTFVRRVLKTIEDDMLVVLSEKKLRATSIELLPKFRAFTNLTEGDYTLPQPDTEEPYNEARSPDLVEANVDPDYLRTFGHKLRTSGNHGKLWPSPTLEQLSEE